MINEPNGPPSDWSPFTHKDKLASGRGVKRILLLLQTWLVGEGM